MEVTEVLRVRLAASLQVQRLRCLWLMGARLTDRAVQAIAGSPFLGQLRELNLSTSSIGEIGIRALVASDTLTEIRGTCGWV